MSYMKREIKSSKKETQIKRIQSCCAPSLYSRLCMRKKDNKIFTLPRRFSKDKCMKTRKKGFTMRSSCSPYRDCKRNLKYKIKKNTKKKTKNRKKYKKS